jgi:hypothetical protein
MTRILRGQGLDQALAYAATQRAGILEKVEARLGPPRVGIDSVNFAQYNFDIPGILEDVPNRLSDISRRKSPSRLDTAAAGIGDALYDRLALHVTLFLWVLLLHWDRHNHRPRCRSVAKLLELRMLP